MARKKGTKGPDAIKARSEELIEKAAFAEKSIKQESGLLERVMQYRGFEFPADAEEFLRTIVESGVLFEQFYQAEQAARHYFRAYEASKQNLKEMESYMAKFQELIPVAFAEAIPFKTADGRTIRFQDLFASGNSRWQSVLVERFGFREPKKK
jgi:hypothetical protein